MARLKIAPRFWRDLENLLTFVAAQAWGNPVARLQDVLQGLRTIAANPEHRPVVLERPGTAGALRRFDAAQFVIVYYYEPPTTEDPTGVVWVRALRHSRGIDVFRGVRESPIMIYSVFKKYVPPTPAIFRK